MTMPEAQVKEESLSHRLFTLYCGYLENPGQNRNEFFSALSGQLILPALRKYGVKEADDEDYVPEVLRYLIPEIDRYARKNDSSKGSWHLCTFLNKAMYYDILDVATVRERRIKKLTGRPQPKQKGTLSYSDSGMTERLQAVEQINILTGRLSDLEKDVLAYRIEGYSYAEGSALLKIPVTKYKNAICRIKKKAGEVSHEYAYGTAKVHTHSNSFEHKKLLSSVATVYGLITSLYTLVNYVVEHPNANYVEIVKAGCGSQLNRFYGGRINELRLALGLPSVRRGKPKKIQALEELVAA